MVISPKIPEWGILGAFTSIQIDDTHNSATICFITTSYEGVSQVSPDTSETIYIMNLLQRLPLNQLAIGLH